VEFRRLGRSGLTVSEISYGNWITHGDQVEADQAIACVRAAFDEGITTFDTADVYAAGRAESVLGEALAGVRRESYELATKVFWPTGPGQNDKGLSRKHIAESMNASLKRLRVDYVDLYQAHRYDPTVPLEETLKAFDDLVRAGKTLYVGVSEWSAEQIADAVRVAGELGLDRIISNQPHYNMLWRKIEAEVVPTSAKVGVSQIVWSPILQGVLTGKYLPGQPPPAASRATGETGATFIGQWLRDDVLLRMLPGRRARRTEAALSRCSFTPPTSLLWAIVFDNSFSTTGKPIERATCTAWISLIATRDSAVGMP